MSSPLTDQRKSWLLLAALWALLLVLAALRPLALPDEGRYAEVGRWMLQSGDWLTPRLNGIPFFHKPPLFYWLEAASIAVFGATAWAVRLVPALHAGLMLVTLYLAARSVGTEALARRAMLMLGTSLAFLLGGQYVDHDTMVAAWIGVAIGCFAFAFLAGEKPDARLARWGFVACAFGVLSKGLIGIVLPGMVLLVWLVWTGQWRKILRLPWFSGLGLFALIAVPWFVLAEMRFPGMLDYMFGKHHFARYTATTFNNPQPWWFYIACLFVLLFPWVFFALYQAFARARKSPAGGKPGSREWTSLAWIWVVVIVGFFSVPNSKLIGYVLPVMPPLALLAALGYGRLVSGSAGWRRAFPVLCALALGIALALNIAAARYSERDSTAELARLLACEAAPGDTVYVVDDYPFDLSFLVQALTAVVVVVDNPVPQPNARDNWHREMAEGAQFEPASGQVLQTPQVLAAASRRPGNWLVSGGDSRFDGFALVTQGRRWSLYRSAATADRAALAPESPKSAERKGLPGCKQQGHQQRRQ